MYHDGRIREAGELLDRVYRLKLTARQNRLVRFLRGVIASRLGDHRKALWMFSARLAVLPALDSHALFYRARALYGMGKWAKAIDLFNRYISLYPDGTLNRNAHLLRAESLDRLGQTDKALKEYRKLARQDQEGEAYLRLARLFEKQGKVDAAREYYLKSLQHSRSSGVRLEAYSRYKELLNLSLVRAGEEDLYLEKVRLLLNEWRLTEALALAEKAMAEGGSPEYLDELAIAKGRALLYLNRLVQAQEYCLQASRSATAKYKAQLLELYARSLRNQGLFEEAARALVLSGKAAATKSEADSAYFLAGVLFLKADKKHEAEEAWRLIRNRVRQGSLADDILWYRAWYHYRHQSWKLAEDDFRTLSRKYPRRARGQAARYWLAKILERLDRQAEAEKHYLALATGEGLYYYRILALERLRLIKPQGAWITHPGVRDLRPLKNSDKIRTYMKTSSQVFSENKPERGEHYKSYIMDNLWAERARIMRLKPVPHASAKLNLGLVRLKNLAAAGVLDLAHEEAEYIQELIAPEKKQNNSKLSRAQKKERNTALKRIRGLLFDFASAYLAGINDYNQYVKLQARYHSTINSSSYEQEYEARRRLYPLSYFNHVCQGAEKHDLDPALILAVIRAESYYDPEVTSNSNAIGLMQVLPSTGRNIARHLNLPDFEVEDLFNPQANITLGTWYLASLLKEFNGQIPLALAAYNAGPFHVKQWVKRSGEIDLEEFIDQIPFTQTRVYVKKILAYYYIYHLLYSGSNLSLKARTPLNKSFLNSVNF